MRNRKTRNHTYRLIIVSFLCLLAATLVWSCSSGGGDNKPPANTGTNTYTSGTGTGTGSNTSTANIDDFLFIHKHIGDAWLDNSLEVELLTKEYIDEVNSITWDTDVTNDSGRPDSLQPTPGFKTDITHWIFWFNDYLNHLKSFGCADGVNKIIMFKSSELACGITMDGFDPGDPFAPSLSLTNYKAVFRHPDGSGNTYTHPSNGYEYKALDDIFAENPDILFIVVTPPPLRYLSTNVNEGLRARDFSSWLGGSWSGSSLSNVYVYNWFDFLAFPLGDPKQNTLLTDYGGSGGLSIPNNLAMYESTQHFTNLLDVAWSTFPDP